MNTPRIACSLFIVLAGIAHWLPAQSGEDSLTVNQAQIHSASGIIGLSFTANERDSMITNLQENYQAYKALRALDIPNEVPPALVFNPVPVGMDLPDGPSRVEWSAPGEITVPGNIEDLAYYSVRDLGYLIKTRKISSLELTRMYLDRLKKYDKQLQCVITYNEDLAIAQAKRADTEIATGKYRGPLHGIPYGIKDLFALQGYKTTWGAIPYKEQVFDYDATVVKKLEDAGAVLIAKLTLGALAWGDVWFGGQTKNPWNMEEGSSGSSAGAAAATAAGLVPFAIGTETWGSIVSPSTRCGTTGLRPTFGRVSRSGAMALSWSMDKIGPITRNVEDCAIVFNAIYGPDGKDRSVIDTPFNYSPAVNWDNLQIGYTKSLFAEDYPNYKNDSLALTKMRSLGAELVAIELPEFPVEHLSFILDAEAAAAFDDLTRSDRDDLMVRQVQNAWPNVFRASRLIPAVEYIQANRARTRLIQKMAELMEDIDVYLCPTFGGDNLLLTNLTGHPCVVLPNGFEGDGTPQSITFTGRLFDEGTLLAVAKQYQNATDFHRKHPPQFP